MLFKINFIFLCVLMLNIFPLTADLQEESWQPDEGCYYGHHNCRRSVGSEKGADEKAGTPASDSASATDRLTRETPLNNDDLPREKNDEEKNDEEKNDDGKSDEEKNDKEKDDEEKNDEEKNDEEKNDDEKSDEEKNDEEKDDEEKNDEEKNDDEKSDEEKNDEEKDDEEKNDEEKSDEDKSDEEKDDEEKKDDKEGEPSPLDFTTIPERVSFDDCEKYMDYLVKKFKEVQLIDFHENSEVDPDIQLKAVRISTIPNEKESEKPAIFITAGAHGNESIPTTSALYVMHMVVEDDHDYWLNAFDWIIWPIQNPGGYQKKSFFTTSWYIVGESGDLGIDMLQNFGIAFRPGRITGDKEYLSNETVATINMPIWHKNIQLFIELGEGNATITYPFSKTSDRANNAHLLKAVAEAGATAVRESRSKGTVYEVQQDCYNGVRYGSSLDSMFEEAAVHIVIRLQMPPAIIDENDAETKDALPRIMEAWSAIRAMLLEANLQVASEDFKPEDAPDHGLYRPRGISISTTIVLSTFVFLICIVITRLSSILFT